MNSEEGLTEELVERLKGRIGCATDIKPHRDFRSCARIEGVNGRLFIGRDAYDDAIQVFLELNPGVSTKEFRRKRNGLLSIKLRKERAFVRSDDLPACIVIKKRSSTSLDIFCRIIANALECASTDQVNFSSTWRPFIEAVKLHAGIDADALTREATVGLLGELLFMRDYVRCSCKGHWSATLASWRGPLKDPQDFVLCGRRIEVKTTSAAVPKRVRIANLKQLEDAGTALYLVHGRLTPSDDEDSIELLDSESDEAWNVSLKEVIAELKGCIRSCPEQLRLFEDKLRLLGIFGDSDLRNEYCERRYRYSGEWKCYGVKDLGNLKKMPFPRLTPQNIQIPEGIDDIAYTIQLEFLEPFVVALVECIGAAEIPLPILAPSEAKVATPLLRE